METEAWMSAVRRLLKEITSLCSLREKVPEVAQIMSMKTEIRRKC